MYRTATATNTNPRHHRVNHNIVLVDVRCTCGHTTTNIIDTYRSLRCQCGTFLRNPEKP